jgi:hypothetical protein
MTGAVTWEVLIWMAGTGSVALLAGWRIVSWALTELGKRDAAIDKLEKDAGLMIGAVESRAKLAEDKLRRSFEAHKLHAAENFATEGGLTQAVNRVDDAVKRLTDRMDRYFEKGDKGG